MESTTQRSDVGTALGSYAQAREWIGRRSELRLTDVAVDESRCKLFAALSEDANPAYWDRQWATAQFGAPLAPSGMTMSLIMSLPWKPGGAPNAAPSLAVDVPLPGQTFINVDTVTTCMNLLDTQGQLVARLTNVLYRYEAAES